ncbi:hypothetical protein M2317_000822 [Microbacterium sp. ZKA21]|uniref:hypothetical protein n=1 Tax=Microbacterium sp. ZKA21 TaxID=3381694 RepID=UPI003D1D2A7F
MTDATGAESAAEGQEPVTPVEGEEQPQERQEGAQDAGQEPAESEKRGNPEAAKYRTQLRAAEAAIADHEAHIAELQEHVISSMIANRVADPKVFAKLVDREAWAGGDGRIDVAKLDASVAQLLEDHPSLKIVKPRPRTSPQVNRGTPVGGAAPASTSAIDRAFPKSGTTMQNLLEKRPDAGTVGDTIQSRNKKRQISARIGGEDE